MIAAVSLCSPLFCAGGGGGYHASHQDSKGGCGEDNWKRAVSPKHPTGDCPQTACYSGDPPHNTTPTDAPLTTSPFTLALILLTLFHHKFAAIRSPKAGEIVPQCVWQAHREGCENGSVCRLLIDEPATPTDQHTQTLSPSYASTQSCAAIGRPGPARSREGGGEALTAQHLGGGSWHRAMLATLRRLHSECGAVFDKVL